MSALYKRITIYATLVHYELLICTRGTIPVKNLYLKHFLRRHFLARKYIFVAIAVLLKLKESNLLYNIK